MFILIFFNFFQICNHILSLCLLCVFQLFFNFFLFFLIVIKLHLFHILSLQFHFEVNQMVKFSLFIHLITCFATNECPISKNITFLLFFFSILSCTTYWPNSDIFCDKFFGCKIIQKVFLIEFISNIVFFFDTIKTILSISLFIFSHNIFQCTLHYISDILKNLTHCLTFSRNLFSD